MSTTDRRTRKRLTTRQSISDAATRLFNERGFDTVTIDEIAQAADVGRMTVFNHFARKEDMFYDLNGEAQDDLLEALRARAPDTGPVEALRRFAHQIVAEGRPYIRFFDGSTRFIQTVRDSETLKARARAIRDELAATVQAGLEETAGWQALDAHLAASLLVATWSVAFIQAHEVYRQTGDRAAAEGRFLAVVDQGSAGVKAAISGKP